MRNLVLALLAAAIAACAGAPASPSGGSGGAASTVADPAGLYRAKCSACHRLYEPASRTREQWSAVLPKMAKKAHLSAGEQEALRGFLDGHASDAAAAGGGGR